MARKTQSEMFPLMEQWEDSTSTQQAFCSAHNLSLATFSYWRTRYLRRQAEPVSAPPTGFVELHPECSGELEVIYPNGVRVRVGEKLPLSDLRALIQLV